MVKIRLTRLGSTHTPFYRVVVSDSRNARDGGVIETLGTYNPLLEKSNIKVDLERAKYWISVGAQPTDTVKQVLVLAGIKFESKAKKPAKKVAKVATTKPADKKA